MSESEDDVKQIWEKPRLDANDYIRVRLDAQQSYHSKKSTKSQNTYRKLNWAQIILAAAIPLVTLFGAHFEFANPFDQILIGVLGALVSVIAGLLAFGQYGQLWAHHRASSEALKTEKAKFKTRCGEYSADIDDDQRLCRLVINVENILGDEHQKWQQLKEQQRKEQQDDAEKQVSKASKREEISRRS